jgi:hypothetical protein
MQQIPTKKILRLLDADQPAEVRASAALVLGEVGVRDAEISSALLERLDDEDATVRLPVIRALGKLRVEAALSKLVERIPDGGPESHEAVEALTRLGAKGVKALQELMHHVAPGVRRIIAAALAVGGTSGKNDTTLGVLLDKDPAVVEAAVRSLSEQIPSFGAEQRSSLTDQLLQLLGNKKTALSPASETGAVRLLAVLGDERAAPVLWDRILPGNAPTIRATALQAVGAWVSSPGKDQLKRLLTCAADRDFRIAGPALLILKKLPVTDKAVAEWLTLFDGADVASRRLALEKLGDRDTADVAKAILQQTRHPDRGLRDAALARLTRLEHGRGVLTEALFAAETPDLAWTLARAQAPFVKDYPEKWREEVFAKASAHLEAEDRQADPLLFVLREAEPHDLRDRLEERALACRKKKQFPKALIYLRLLGRDPACGLPIRMELAACGLKVSGKDLSAEDRANDPCLEQFVRLCHQDDAAVTEYLAQANWLEAEELYYLGFHLAEQEGRAKKVAAEVLKLVVKKSPRSKLAQSAKSKLRSSGLE